MVPRRRRGRLAGRALSHPYVLRGQNTIRARCASLSPPSALQVPRPHCPLERRVLFSWYPSRQAGCRSQHKGPYNFLAHASCAHEIMMIHVHLHVSNCVLSVVCCGSTSSHKVSHLSVPQCPNVTPIEPHRSCALTHAQHHTPNVHEINAVPAKVVQSHGQTGSAR